jgi:signal transduction histidine kinase/DNA-binding NarL/FixJ family response regulator
MFKKIQHYFRRSLKNKFVVITPMMIVLMVFLFLTGIVTMRKAVFDQILARGSSQVRGVHKLIQSQVHNSNALHDFFAADETILYVASIDANQFSYSSIFNGLDIEVNHFAHEILSSDANPSVHRVRYNNIDGIEFIFQKNDQQTIFAQSLSWFQKLLLIQTLLLVAIGLIAILICSVIIISISYLIADPICKLTAKIQNLTDETEQNGIEVFTKRPDEIGFLATKVVAWVAKIKEQAEIIKEQAKMVAVGETASHMAHDVRRPFNSVRAILAMMDIYKDNPAELKRVKGEVEEQIYQVDHMLADIMDFARTEKLELRPLSLHQIVNFALTNSPRLFAHKEIVFEYQLNHTYLPRVDEMRISRVFINIIENAVDAMTVMERKKEVMRHASCDMRRGEVMRHETCDMSAAPRAKREEDEEARCALGSKPHNGQNEGAWVGANSNAPASQSEPGAHRLWFHSQDYEEGEQKYTEVAIGNSGPAIPEEALTKLFESFFTSGKVGGTGLGLAAVRKIMQLSGGNVFARNCAGVRGVEFVLRFPVSVEREHGLAKYLPQSGRELKPASKHKVSRSEMDAMIKSLEHRRILPLKVLLVEDEEVYATHVRCTIMSHPVLSQLISLFEVATVSDAIKVAHKEAITLALIDVDLGKPADNKDGYGFLVEAKLLPIEVSSLVHSNRITEDAVAKAYQLGALGFMSKPLVLEDMVSFFYDPQGFQRKYAAQGPSSFALNDVAPESSPESSVVTRETSRVISLGNLSDAKPSSQNREVLNLAILTTRKIDGQYVELTLRDALDPLNGKQIETRTYTAPEELAESVGYFKPQILVSDFSFATFQLGDNDPLFFQIKQMSPATAIFCLTKNGSEPPVHPHIDGWFNPLHDSEEIGKVLQASLDSWDSCLTASPGRLLS